MSNLVENVLHSAVGYELYLMGREAGVKGIAGGEEKAKRRLLLRATQTCLLGAWLVVGCPKPSIDTLSLVQKLRNPLQAASKYVKGVYTELSLTDTQKQCRTSLKEHPIKETLTVGPDGANIRKTAQVFPSNTNRIWVAPPGTLFDRYATIKGQNTTGNSWTREQIWFCVQLPNGNYGVTVDSNFSLRSSIR